MKHKVRSLKTVFLRKTFLGMFIFAFVYMGLYNVISNNKLWTRSEDDPSKITKVSAFTNDAFPNGLGAPTHQEGNETEVFVSFTDVFNKVKQALDVETINDTIQVKKARDASLKTALQNEVGQHRISISSAEELYHFSVALAYNYTNTGIYNPNDSLNINRYPYVETLTYLMSLNYALLSDIDYQPYRANKFIPIGINFANNVNFIWQFDALSEYSTAINIPFNGTFDGNGFTISNLYFADYARVTTVHNISDDESGISDIAVTNYYAMFASVGPNGVVKNFKLVNPVFELLDAPRGLTKTATIAGLNQGTISNVGVIDEKTTQAGLDNSGIRFNIQYTTNDVFEAAGFVFENQGTVKNSYFISNRVIAQASWNRFTTVRSFVFSNSGTLKGNLYDNRVSYKEPLVNGLMPSRTEFSDVNGYTTLEIIDGMDTNLNEEASRKWYFYKEDGYPELFGLEYDDTNEGFLIRNEYDFISFGKLLNLQSDVPELDAIEDETISKKYHSQTYYLVDHINMINIPSYKTPSQVFYGTLTSLDSVDLSSITQNSQNTNKYIYNLTIRRPHVQGNNYYLGLFSVIGQDAQVSHINFYNNHLIATDTQLHYGKVFYMGMVAGVMDKAEVHHLISDTLIELGTQAIGSSYVGGIVGQANGLISYVVNKNHINGGMHQFNGLPINATYYVGGIFGRNNDTLSLNNAFNFGNVTGVGATDTAYTANNVNSYTGGILGEVENYSVEGNNIKYVTNNGKIDANIFNGKADTLSKQYVGGIFGSVAGFGFKLSEFTLTGTEIIRNGRYENNGIIKATYQNTYTYVYASGITTMNTTGDDAHISYMTNGEDATFEISNLNYGNINKYVYYAATVIDNTAQGITLSRAYNYASYKITESFFSNNSGIIREDIRIALFFASVEDQGKAHLIYVENHGNLYVGPDDLENISGNTPYITVDEELKISNITQAINVNYLNVKNSGNIEVLKLKSKEKNASDQDKHNAIYVAGIAWMLPFVETAHEMKNVVNSGDITVADIGNNTKIANVSGMQVGAGTFESSLVNRNVYIAGIVNINVGKITNTFNLGNISTTSNYTYTVGAETVVIKDVKGTANVFAGGIATFNYYLIQDAANSGILNLENSTSDSANRLIFVAGGSDTSDTSAAFGGLVYQYNSGVVIGGIVASFGDSTGSILNAYNVGHTHPDVFAQVLDTANNGDVFGKSNHYVRSGGIVGTALGVELAAGTYSAKSDSTTGIVGRFGTSITGSGDKIAKTQLKNGLNFGSIFAITNVIGTYTGTNTYSSNTTSGPTAQRPGIYASAGGVIGYGLTEMERMLNHGTIASTDVAGGIVGATYILGTNNDNLNEFVLPVTYVTINTAVHYGSVKAAKRANFNLITFQNRNNFDNTNIYYPDNDPYLFPVYTQGRYLSLHPNKKPGFGGIFGRLQRGRRGVMQSNQFINIMNMDPNIDMIGRADQSGYLAMIFYRFYTGETDTYYTARANDTSPGVVTGYLNRVPNVTNAINYLQIDSATSITYNILRETSWFGTTYYYVTSVQVAGGEGRQFYKANRTVAPYNPNLGDYTSYNTVNSTTTYVAKIFTNRITNHSASYTYSGSARTIEEFGLTTADMSQITNWSNNQSQIVRTSGEVRLNTTTTLGTGDQPYKPEVVTDDENITNRTYIFDEAFPLMDEENSTYIYYVENVALADRFRLQQIQNPSNPNQMIPNPTYKQNGMYVLASSNGRTQGAVLPSNIKSNEFKSLNESGSQYYHLEDINNDDLTDDAIYETLNQSHRKMFQLRYNESSRVLPQTEGSTLSDLVLYNKESSPLDPMLADGVFGVDVNGNPTITFTVSKSAFSRSAFSYSVYSAVLSENAVIAKNNILNTETESFQTAYENNRDGYSITDGSFAALYEGNVPSPGGQVAFDLTVYSEIAAHHLGSAASNLTENDLYHTVYKVIIVVDNTELNMYPTIYLDGSGQAATSNSNGVQTTVTAPLMDPKGRLTAVFTEAGLLPKGHLMYIEGLYSKALNGTLTPVSLSDYDFTVTPKNLNNFGFEMNLSDTLNNGDYVIKYRFYQNQSVVRLIEFKKSASDNFEIRSVSYDTYSFNASGNVLTFTPTGTNTTFTTYMEFNHTFAETLTNITIEQAPGFTLINPTYIVKIDGHQMQTFVLAPYATMMIPGVDGLEYAPTLSYGFIENSTLKEYIFNFYVKAQSASTPVEITHKIVERVLENASIYKDSNLQISNTFDVERESLLTSIDIDFKFSPNALNAQVVVKDDNGDIYGNPTLNNNDETTIYYENTSTSDYFNLYLTDKLEVGTYVFVFELNRGTVENPVMHHLAEITIHKVQGVNGYLLDINFQEDQEGLTLVYPTISVLDGPNALNKKTQYKLSLFSDGIEYMDAKENNERFFYIQGQVSEIMLDSYAPIFTLPFGGKIHLYTGSMLPGEVESGILNENNFVGSGLEDDLALRTNFEEGADVLYRVTSEDGLTKVYYIINAIDIRYRLTIRFSLYYQLNDTVVPAKSMEVLENKVALITVQNFDMGEGDFNTTGDTQTGYTYPNIFVENGHEGVNNQSSLYFYIDNDDNYIYRFGRNLMGAYNFNVVTPKQDENTRYHYEIYRMDQSETSYWFDEKYKLPPTQNGYNGYFFFIKDDSSTRQITIEFAIVIIETIPSSSWGLHDETTSWDNIN